MRVFLNVQTDSERADVVRCLTCHTLYEQDSAPAQDNRRGCPECGSFGWLALRVPIEQSGRPVRP